MKIPDGPRGIIVQQLTSRLIGTGFTTCQWLQPRDASMAQMGRYMANTPVLLSQNQPQCLSWTNSLSNCAVSQKACFSLNDERDTSFEIQIAVGAVYNAFSGLFCDISFHNLHLNSTKLERICKNENTKVISTCHKNS